LVARTLITSSNEKIWPQSQDVPVLFIGEWDKKFSRKHKWIKLNSSVVQYHWDDRQMLHDDFKYLQVLYEKTLVEISEQLNLIHNTQYSIRFWRILIGPWLGYFSQILFDRWKSIQNALENHELSQAIIFDYQERSFIPSNMTNFMLIIHQDDWNHNIYSTIIKKYSVLNYKTIRSEQNEKPQSLELSVEANIASISRNKAKKEILFSIYTKIASLFKRDSDALLINTYLSVLDELKLFIRLKQVPLFFRTIEEKKIAFDKFQRTWNLNGVNKSDFESFLREMIPLHIPVTYLEGFSSLNSQIDALSWPRRPKAIFTSSSYSTDDVFKAYAAEKTENGTPLVIGQHGGGIGTHLWAFYEDHQIKISDSYLSWGWSESSNTKIKPIGKLKSNKQLTNMHHLQSRILLVTADFSLRSNHLFSAPISSQWLSYFDDQCVFVRSLSPQIQNSLTVRLRIGGYGNELYEQWRDKFPEISLENGNENINSLVKTSRIYVATYNGTTFLESFEMNIPTVIFWNPEHWELRKSAIPFFEKLKEVGVLHETSESAANHVNTIWLDVNAWWQRDDVQEAVNLFKSQYSHKPKSLTNRVEAAIHDAIGVASKTF
jgi:putative transferase (TIGR04331 family)